MANKKSEQIFNKSVKESDKALNLQKRISFLSNAKDNKEMPFISAKVEIQSNCILFFSNKKDIENCRKPIEDEYNLWSNRKQRSPKQIENRINQLKIQRDKSRKKSEKLRKEWESLKKQ